MTRAELQAAVLRVMDATGSARWDTTVSATGEVDSTIGSVMDREWRRILTHQRYYRTAKRTPTADAQGRFAISDLTSGSGDSQERFYRVLAVMLANRVYKEVEFIDWPLGAANGLSAYVWYRNGNYIECLPTPAAGAVPDGIWVNHIPVRCENLAGAGSTITFPDGYEQILVYETAARLLAKGGAELEATFQFQRLAEEMRQDMLQDLARFSTKPLGVRYDDFPHEWAG